MSLLERVDVALTAEQIAGAVRRAASRAEEVEDRLNGADRRLGDGDTGITLRRLLHRLGESSASPPDDIGAFFEELSRAASGATGSTLGTVIAIGLQAVARGTRGQEEILLADLWRHLDAARDAMSARGGAALGDKTVIDELDAVARAIQGIEDRDAMGRVAMEAAVGTLDAFRTQRSKVGRARMFGDQSIGVDDPGMLAFVLFLGAIVGEQPAGSSPGTS